MPDLSLRSSALPFALGALALLCALLLPASASAQSEPTLRIGTEDGPRLDLDMQLMQGAQFLEADEGAYFDSATDGSFGLQRLRFNLALSATINDRLSLFADLGHEPNDFGENFAPVVDLAYADFLVTEGLTARFGIPVTTLFNFRGYSDGAGVQSNPLIGNSPADMITARTGTQLLGDYGPVTFDLGYFMPTFYEDFRADRGFFLIGKGTARLLPGLRVGAGYSYSNHGGQIRADSTPDEVLRADFIFSDGENYHLPGLPVNGRLTHIGNVPGVNLDAFHVDAEYDRDGFPLTVDAWYGYLRDDYSFIEDGGAPTVRSQATGFEETESATQFFGVTGAYDLTDRLYLASRFTMAFNESDWAGDENQLTRIQVGAGYRFLDRALFKVEYVRQTEQQDSPGQIGSAWGGVLAEFSVDF